MTIGLTKRPWFRRLGVGLGLLIVVAAAVLYRYPWSVAAISEAYPDKTWPAGGDFVHGGRPVSEPSRNVRIVKPTDAFMELFEGSGGTAAVVMKDGEIVNSTFGFGESVDTKHNSFSMAKSLVGVLTLQALSDGLIPSLDSTAGQLWPQLDRTELAPTTVGQLLDMRSGIAFEKDPGEVGDAQVDKVDALDQASPFGSMARLHVEGVDAVVSHARLIEADSGVFSYQNINTAVLARILEELRGKPIDEILADEIADPAGAGEFTGDCTRHPMVRSAPTVACTPTQIGGSASPTSFSAMERRAMRILC